MALKKKSKPAKARSVKPRVRKVRRIITGHDKAGRSIIASDKPSPFVMAIRGIPTHAVTDVWKTKSCPPDNSDGGEPCSLPIELAPPVNGTVLRVVEFPPDRVWKKTADPAAAFASMGRSGAAAHETDTGPQVRADLELVAAPAMQLRHALLPNRIHPRKDFLR